MALRHRTLPIAGVQFHPESILTPAGQTLLGNFLSQPAPDWASLGPRPSPPVRRKEVR
jgi:anthranilate synthase component 2